jgi:hypothetical protein
VAQYLAPVLSLDLGSSDAKVKRAFDHMDTLDAIFPQSSEKTVRTRFGSLRSIHRLTSRPRVGARLMSRLGHATPTMSLRYQHATTERDTAIADRHGALIRAVEQQPAADGAEVRSIGK